MSSNEGNCCQNQEEIKQIQDDKINFTLLSNLKYEEGEDDADAKWLPSSPSEVLRNVEAGFSPLPFSIKREPEEFLEYDFQLQQQAENAGLKTEVDIDDHKPGWESMRRNSDGLDQHGSVQNYNESQSSNVYKCQECPYKTGNKDKFAQPVYKCLECSFETRVKHSLKGHYKYKHSKTGEMYKCHECSYETIRKGDLSSHYKYKHAKEAEVFKCEECSFESIYKSSVVKHYKLKHTKEAELYKCRECSYQTKNKSHFNRHRKYKHSEEVEVYQCMECSCERRYKWDMKNHCAAKHDKCSFETRIITASTRHLKIKHEDDEKAKLFKCGECSFKTKRKHLLSAHFNNKHSKDPKVYKCQECSFKTRYQSCWSRHNKLKHKQ